MARIASQQTPFAQSMVNAIKEHGPPSHNLVHYDYRELKHEME